MAYALIAHTAASSANNTLVTTSGIDTTGATLIVAAVADYDAVTIGTPTDLQGGNSNSWTPLTTYASTAAARMRLYYVVNPAYVGSSHTFSYSVSFSYPAIAVAAFSGAAASPFDDESGASVAANTTLAPGSKTPSEANCLLVTGLCYSTTDTPISVDGGFSISDQLPNVPSFAYGIGLAYLIQTSAAAANPAWTWTTSQAAAVGLAIFKAAAAAAGHPTMRRWGSVPHLGGRPMSPRF